MSHREVSASSVDQSTVRPLGCNIATQSIASVEVFKHSDRWGSLQNMLSQASRRIQRDESSRVESISRWLNRFQVIDERVVEVEDGGDSASVTRRKRRWRRRDDAANIGSIFLLVSCSRSLCSVLFLFLSSSHFPSFLSPLPPSPFKSRSRRRPTKKPGSSCSSVSAAVSPSTFSRLVPSSFRLPSSTPTASRHSSLVQNEGHFRAKFFTERSRSNSQK
mmetsp:Transcript_1831/g.2668  ORF Transcript_1831/g.2668 Transcript_1831/m.2668 type:complete len:219 (-) Transcript_1831:633-1289(-)